MLSNYLKIAFRNLVNQKVYTAINVAGLTAGITCCLLIALFIRDELSFDRYHEHADRIYRVTRDWVDDAGNSTWHFGVVAPTVAPLLRADFPDLEVVRLRQWGSLLQHGERSFYEDGLFFVEPELLSIFSFPFLEGDPNTALARPFTAMITEAAAAKYFGSESAIGKVISLEGAIDLEITGILAEVPRNSHFSFEVLASFSSLEKWGAEDLTNWGGNNFATYVLLPEGGDSESLQSQLPAFLDRHLGDEASERTRLHLQPLTDIHLHSHLDVELGVNGDIAYVYMLSLVGLFVLLIACINFMNLSTARSQRRSREVGLRKVVGARRRQLVFQFLGESLLLSAVSVVAAIAIVETVLPSFNAYVGRDLEIEYAGDGVTIILFAGIAVVVGLVSGSYPALFLSRSQPVHVLKGEAAVQNRSRFRTYLVVFQFAISVGLIACTGVIYNQLEYCQDAKLGFERERVVTLHRVSSMKKDLEAFRLELVKHHRIASAAASSRVPSDRLNDGGTFKIAAGEGGEMRDVQVRVVSVGFDFVDTYGIELAAGRNLSRSTGTDAQEGYLINQQLARNIGAASDREMIGAAVDGWGRTGHVVGVVEDFHFESMHEHIRPLLMYINPEWTSHLSARLTPGDPSEALAHLRDTWDRFNPDRPLGYSFADERFDLLYRSEQRWGEILGGFSLLAIFIACLGLWGLASYSTMRRTKEIGVRKVLGASVANIALLLSRESTMLVAIGCLAAWPVSYLLMEQWLQSFSYRADFGVFTYLAGGLAALAIAWCTVGYRAIRAGLSNPVDSLRYE